jgi:phosphoenolpyruvate synthase/pyruvate phosphate dikinase
VLPSRLLEQVAFLARHLEYRFQGIPQDIEWSFDGQQLWLLQSRPITTLVPIWTRKIAAEVIPGAIRPLTWSINRPLTCGVWGQIFTLVLGKRAADLDFSETATLHRAHAYFNATLLGDIFLRMGLPPESLEFLTRGAKFSRPPLRSTLINLPGLWRLASRERSLLRDFAKDNQQLFQPGLTALYQQSIDELSVSEIKQRIAKIRGLLEKATYYNILAPLSLAFRQAIAKVDQRLLNNQASPEIVAIATLRNLAITSQDLLNDPDILAELGPTPELEALLKHPKAQALHQGLQTFLQDYGYLSEVATDIAVPTWQEDPAPVKALLASFLLPNASSMPPNRGNPASYTDCWPAEVPRDRKTLKRVRQVQARVDLKGQVAEVYNRLLALLRQSFIALEQQWLQQSHLQNQGDIFFLTWPELDQPSPEQWPVLVRQRRADWLTNSQQAHVPYLVYGSAPLTTPWQAPTVANPAQILKGIGASPGIVEGRIQILKTLDATIALDPQTILVVPYTDAGWAPLLAQIGGLIAEVGGQLSHGAIVAREYGIPAVMNVPDATHRLWNGQRVRLDGAGGIIEVVA